MLGRIILRPTCRTLLHLPRHQIRSIASTNGSSPRGGTPPPQREKSWLTHKVETSPTAKTLFTLLAKLLGYGSLKQVAGRRAFVLYESVCAAKPDDERAYWQTACHLPPTFQSWFTVTNLHVWLLTCRLRALPPAHGKHYIQALIDHFFIDIEDRIRTVLQPPQKPTQPYTLLSSFYVNPSTSVGPSEDNDDGLSSANPTKKNPTRGRGRGRAPDRLVTRQMKIFKEQWMGLGLSFDLALMQGDMEMAAAIWRNLLGARGARGIAYPSEEADGRSAPSSYRRAVNLVGGEVVNVAKIDVDKEELKNDGSGVHDFPPQEVDKYVQYPELMLELVEYVRRELVRLEKVSDEEIMSGRLDKIKFGRVREGQ